MAAARLNPGKERSMKVFFISLAILFSTLYASATDKVGDISADEFELSFQLSSDTVFADSKLVASLVLYSPYEITAAEAVDKVAFKNFELVKSVGPNYIGLQFHNGNDRYAYILAQYTLRPEKSGKHRLSSPEFDITAVTYERVSDGFFIFPRAKEHKVKLKSVSTKVLVLPESDPRIDTSRFPTSVAMTYGFNIPLLVSTL